MRVDEVASRQWRERGGATGPSRGSSATARISRQRSAAGSGVTLLFLSLVFLCTSTALRLPLGMSDPAMWQAQKEKGVNVRVGVGVLVLQEGRPNHVLISKRLGSHGAGRHQLPGGHLELGESWEGCAIREVEEETGIRLERALFAGVTNDVMPEDGKHYVDIIMMGVCKATDEAKNMEPSKCGGWFWAPWDSIPEGRFASLANLNASPFILPSPGEVTGGGLPCQAFPSNAAYMTGQSGEKGPAK